MKVLRQQRLYNHCIEIDTPGQKITHFDHDKNLASFICLTKLDFGAVLKHLKGLFLHLNMYIVDQIFIRIKWLWGFVQTLQQFGHLLYILHTFQSIK